MHPCAASFHEDEVNGTVEHGRVGRVDVSNQEVLEVRKRKPWPEMRQETVSLRKQGIAGKHRAYLLINNRSEGNAPLTMGSMRSADRLTRRIQRLSIM